MKLLKIEAEGLPLFRSKLEIWFYALQRIDESARDMLIPLTDKYFLNPVQAVIGKNASGKTTILKTVTFILHMLGAESINNIATRNILGTDRKVSIKSYFYLERENTINVLDTVIMPRPDLFGVKYYIEHEELYSKDAGKVVSKKYLLDFSQSDRVLVRDDRQEYLSDDVSIIISWIKKYGERFYVEDILSMTDVNIMPATEDIPPAVISYLDPSVERIYFRTVEERQEIHLKFFGKNEMLLRDSRELNIYLSSGTIKGIVAFMSALDIMKKGGYLVIDELENHFNKEIAATLIRFFMDRKVNPSGGVLLFSTHYAELLDEFPRSDSIYLTRNENGINTENLRTAMKRNDISKSAAYLSGIIEGTVPEYDSYIALRKQMIASVEKGPAYD